MCCFFSIGFDASITHEFKLKRESEPGSCDTRTKNKAYHAWFGIKQLIKPMDYIDEHIKLIVDGIVTPLPKKIRSLQVLNIHSSADGVDFFAHAQDSIKEELQNFKPPAINDGLLEVVGYRGMRSSQSLIFNLISVFK